MACPVDFTACEDVLIRSFLLTFFAFVSLAKARPAEAVHSPRQPGPFFYTGNDLSSLKILEDGAAIYDDTARNNAT